MLRDLLLETIDSFLRFVLNFLQRFSHSIVLTHALPFVLYHILVEIAVNLGVASALVQKNFEIDILERICNFDSINYLIKLVYLDGVPVIARIHTKFELFVFPVWLVKDRWI